MSHVKYYLVAINRICDISLICTWISRNCHVVEEFELEDSIKSYCWSRFGDMPRF